MPKRSAIPFRSLAHAAAGQKLRLITKSHSDARSCAPAVQATKNKKAVTSGGAAAPAWKCKEDELPGIESLVAVEDGENTPASGAMRIQHSENDATVTLPKLPFDPEALARAAGDGRVKAEVVTAGESPGFMRGRAAVAQGPYKPLVGGANPPLATAEPTAERIGMRRRGDLAPPSRQVKRTTRDSRERPATFQGVSVNAVALVLCAFFIFAVLASCIAVNGRFGDSTVPLELR